MRILILLLAATFSAFAQEEAEIITVKTLTGESFDRLMGLIGVMGNVRYKGDSQLRTIVAYGTKENVAQMRRLVEQLDRPGSEAAIGRNIEMTLTFLHCSTKPSATPVSLPADLESVGRQLRAATQYKDIQLLDILPLRLQEGKDTWENLRLPGFYAAGQSVSATIQIRPEGVFRKDQGRYVRFARMDINFRVPIATGTFRSNSDVQPLANTQFSFQDFGLKTAGDFVEGQKTVLGKVSGLTEDDAIFTVVTLKILD